MALNGDAAAALVLAQIVGLTDPVSRCRESSRFRGLGFQHSFDPKKFSEASAVVLSDGVEGACERGEGLIKTRRRDLKVCSLTADH
ncbi:hypothetical protein QCM77_07680 [Bradyrhizobium sp. SSUT18]|uniref:hypothetical protein n=1 Tax=Bradyrhizobium sp. SSUT18 TaxID=3040602 RepID=UPI00244C4C67|nr:hypothetical protein [Bradyrhizobium sp. SSUT18]MDH2399825.1 hypothetical protein [Bradyrhizobium sp. SSUT18]